MSDTDREKVIREALEDVLCDEDALDPELIRLDMLHMEEIAKFQAQLVALTAERDDWKKQAEHTPWRASYFDQKDKLFAAEASLTEARRALAHVRAVVECSIPLISTQGDYKRGYKEALEMVLAIVPAWDAFPPPPAQTGERQ